MLRATDKFDNDARGPATGRVTQQDRQRTETLTAMNIGHGVAMWTDESYRVVVDKQLVAIVPQARTSDVNVERREHTGP